MKIVAASDSFKGSLTSRQVGEAIARAVQQVSPEIIVEILSVADGGEGTMEAIISSTDGAYHEIPVFDPLGRQIHARYGTFNHYVIIEMAQASGLTLLSPEERNPLHTTSYGTGQLILDALKRGYRKFLVGIGGSATNDGGVGMLQALGFRFSDRNGSDIGFGACNLQYLHAIESSEFAAELKESQFTIACDVTNPLTGPRGASHIFAAQKGADAAMIKSLEAAMKHYAQATALFSGKDFSRIPGSGAAGGTGFALMAYLDASLRPGIETVLDSIGFDQRIQDADLIITGEGHIDRQTLMGKAPMGVLRRATRRNIPVIAIGGGVDTDAIPLLKEAGFCDVLAVADSQTPLEEAMKPEIAEENIFRTVRDYIISRNKCL